MLENLCKKFGIKQEFNGYESHTFPKAEILAKAPMKDLIDCKLGFRAKYVKEASQAVNSGEIDFAFSAFAVLFFCGGGCHPLLQPVDALLELLLFLEPFEFSQIAQQGDPVGPHGCVEP